ncbi:uncharacterized protein [Arachis hypogaea]|uniref:uncharacterized protein isoform X2 n=1 Tax=Arachis hypogaea TaxID=3818 RepID=UPI000DECE873|nr:uncharacterized protein LOC112802192 isoform X2 [Arachis hypogaea]
MRCDGGGWFHHPCRAVRVCRHGCWSPSCCCGWGYAVYGRKKASLPLPENLSAAGGRSTVDPPELLATVGAVAGAGSKLHLLRFVNSSLRLLQKTSGAGILVVDFGLRRKGLCETFGLWNLRFEMGSAKESVEFRISVHR